MRKQFAQVPGRPQRCSEQSTGSQCGHALVEFVAGRFDLVAERLEQPPEESLAATAGDRCEPRFEWQCRLNQFGLELASSTQGGVEPTGEHDREQRRSDVRAIVDVLVLCARLSAATAHHTDGIDVEQYARGARILASLRIEDRRGSEWELPGVDVLRVLVQQESQVGSRSMRGSNGQ